MDLLKKIHGYWTVWLGYMMIAIPIIHDQWEQFSGWLPEEWKYRLYPLLGAAVVLTRVRRDVLNHLKGSE